MLKQLPMTARLNNTGSVNRYLQRPEKKQTNKQTKSTNTPSTEPESQTSVLRTPTTAYFCSAFKDMIFNSLSFSETIAA